MSDRISVIEFLSATKDDVNSPTTSTFSSKMSLCRSTISALEESLDADRSALKKMKNSIKSMHNSGKVHANNGVEFFENLEKLGSAALCNNKESEPEIGSAFLKLAVFTKEISSLLKTVVSTINNILMFPMESLLKGDLKGLKGDMKRPFEKSWKDYDNKVKQVEREKRQLAKDAGMIRSEISGAEIAEEMEKERRMFQLQMCEYLIKVNEIKTKKGVDFLQHLVEYYHAEHSYFTDGVKVMEEFRAYVDDLTANLQSLRQGQDEEKRQLIELRNTLKLSVSDGDNSSGKTQANVYNLHQLQGNKALGNEKCGYLMKRSEGLRKAWQKRKCFVTDGYLTMHHNKANKDPVKLNLLTSQLKLVAEDKKQFDLVSHNRTYRFMAEDEHDAMHWVSVLTNSKDDALNRVFGDSSSGKGGTEQNTGLKELTLSIIDEVRRLPGNDRCCDCNAPDPTWLSTNLGVLLCIECSGIHRDMGVHVSRIQSLTLDELGTSELLLARSIGNDTFNNVMEENLDLSKKLTSTNDMEERKAFIRGKYISRNYVVYTCNNDPETLADELGQAIRSCDMFSLLQLFGENADLAVPLPGYEEGETALHAAVSLHSNDEVGSILPLVDFLCQNVGSALNLKTTASGNTPLHICAENNKTECMKLLLRSKANTDIENANGETALAIAKSLKHTGCMELLEQANSGKFRPIVHIDIDWNLTFMDDDDFLSDDDLDDRNFSPQGSMQSPMKVQTAEGRHRISSFKDRGKSSADPLAPPPLPRTTPPAVPPHQNLNRNRSQSMAPPQSVADGYRAKNSPLSHVLPTKPTNKLANKPALPTPSPATLNKENDSVTKRGCPPEVPAKSAKPTKGINIQHFASFGGNRRKSRPAKPVSSSLATKKTTSSAARSKAAVDPTDARSADVFSHGTRKCNTRNSSSKKKESQIDDDLCNLVSPRKVLKPRPSFAVKHSLSTSNGGNPPFPLSPVRYSTLPARLSLNSPRTFHRLSSGNQSPSASKRDTKPSSPSQNVSKHQSVTTLPSRGDASPSNDYSHAFYNSNATLHDQSPVRNTANYRSPATTWPNEQLNATGKKNSTTIPFPSAGFQPIPSARPTTFSYEANDQLMSLVRPPTLAVTNHETGHNFEKSKSLPRNSNFPMSQFKSASSPSTESPVPLPRSNATAPSPPRPKRVRAIYDCEADNKDELTFVENEIIVVTGVEDQEWWVGHVEHQPHRTGVFPVSFVHVLPE